MGHASNCHSSVQLTFKCATAIQACNCHSSVRTLKGPQVRSLRVAVIRQPTTRMIWQPTARVIRQPTTQARSLGSSHVEHSPMRSMRCRAISTPSACSPPRRVASAQLRNNSDTTRWLQRSRHATTLLLRANTPCKTGSKTVRVQDEGSPSKASWTRARFQEDQASDEQRGLRVCSHGLLIRCSSGPEMLLIRCSSEPEGESAAKGEQRF